jgi:hypothetical protein
MTDEERSNVRLPQPLGADKGFILKLFSKPEGFFFLVALIVEGMLFLIFIVGHTDTERLLALGGFLVVLVILIIFFSWERQRVHRLDMRKLQPRAVPESMTAAPIKTEEADRAPDLMTSEDGTFVYGRAPANWRVQKSSVEAETHAAMSQQGMAEIATETVQKFRAGPVVIFNEVTPHEIIYVPGKSLVNGRLAFGVFNEVVTDQVGMFSVSKRGGMMRDMSPEHVFAQVVAGMVGAGVKIDSIRVAPSEVGGRATLTARGILKIEHALIDGVEITSATVEVRLHVVEYSNFVYVIQTRLIEGIPTSDARRVEMEEIIGTFRAASAANAAERERKDAAEADKSFEKVMQEGAADMLMFKAKSLLREMAVPDGVPRVTSRHVEAIKTLESYAVAFPGYVSEDDRDALQDFRERAEAAFAGQPARLAELMQSVLTDEAQARLPAAAG